MNAIQNLKAVAAYAGATINTATDTDSTIIIDTKGYDFLKMSVLSGAITAAGSGATVKVMESTASNGANPTEATALGSKGAFTADGDDNVVRSTDVVLSKRYALLRITSAASFNGIILGAVAILGNKRLPSD